MPLLYDHTGSEIVKAAPPVAPVAGRKQRRPASYGGGLDWAFDSARTTGYRGWFWFPNLDPDVQINQWTRTQTARKVNWCYNNIGAIKAVIDGLAVDEVDTGLWPKPATKSRAFNMKVKILWGQQCGFHKSFSSDGENNFYSAQLMTRREIRLRGDCFGQKLRAGEEANCPQMHFIPSWQCDNASWAEQDTNHWRDGRRDNRLGRAMAWSFATDSKWSATTTVPAEDIVHLHDPFLIGQKRGISALAPVVRKMFSLDDIERNETNGVVMRSRMAYAIERTDDDTPPTLLPGAAEVEEVKQKDGSTLFIQKLVARDGYEVDVAEMPAGKKLTVVESNKSSESGTWLVQLLTDIAYATLYPPQYVFSLAGMNQGTLVRLVQGKIQRVLNTVRDFQIIMQMIDEWWPFWLWQNIKAGNLDDVRGGIPDEWWQYLVVRPKDMTVDMGREGKLYDDRVGTGKMPSGLYVGMIYGEDEEEFEDQIIRDAYRRRLRNEEIAKEFGVEPLNIDEIFRPPSNHAALPPSQDDPDSDPDEEEEEEKDEKKKK